MEQVVFKAFTRVNRKLFFGFLLVGGAVVLTCKAFATQQKQIKELEERVEALEMPKNVSGGYWSNGGR